MNPEIGLTIGGHILRKLFRTPRHREGYRYRAQFRIKAGQPARAI